MTAAAFPLVRNVAALGGGKTYDLLVVGGGIYGAWTAYDAAQRGHSVALVERADWGSGTSQASSKLIHGGLRYLETFEFGLVRHALTERRILARLAPHLVRPMNFVLPLWRGGRVGPLRLGAGLMLYDWLSWGRQPVQHHRRFRAERLRERYPFLAPDGLRGGFRYGDCQEDDARLVTVVVAAAQAAGAVCVNRMAAERVLWDGERLHGAELRDQRDGTRYTLRAAQVVTAAGPWVGRQDGVPTTPVKLVKGTHLVMPAIPGCQSAFLLTAPQDGRVFFVIPWYHRTLIGTTESEIDDPDHCLPTEDEARYLLSAANAWLPGLNWTPADIIARFAGTRALQAQSAGALSKVTREFEITEPRPGLWLPIGGKYTTARHDAARIVDSVCARAGLRGACATDSVPLPGAPDGDFVEWQAEACARLARLGVDEEAARWVSLRHGAGVRAIIECLQQHPQAAARLAADSPYIGAEAVIAVRDEMATHIDDVLRRRTPLALLSTQADTAREAAIRLIRQVDLEIDG